MDFSIFLSRFLLRVPFVVVIRLSSPRATAIYLSTSLPQSLTDERSIQILSREEIAFPDRNAERRGAGTPR